MELLRRELIGEPRDDSNMRVSHGLNLLCFWRVHFRVTRGRGLNASPLGTGSVARLSEGGQCAVRAGGRAWWGGCLKLPNSFGQ
eukprot:5589604-Lingulodinium_polyedra.AAC.1